MTSLFGRVKFVGQENLFSLKVLLRKAIVLELVLLLRPKLFKRLELRVYYIEHQCLREKKY